MAARSRTATRPLEGKASLSQIRRHIRADLKASGTDASLAFDCLVAVTEACTNALLHGRRSSSDNPPPELTWEIDAACARFCIQDFSDERWARAVHPSRGDEALEDEAGAGFGFEIMKGLMDEVEVTPGVRGTTVTLVKRLA